MDMQAQFAATFPLQIGNRWFYREHFNLSDPFRIRKVLYDTTMPNGLSYAAVLDSGYSYQVVRYYRQSGSRVYQYGYFVAGQEQLVFDFSRADGDTIASFRNGQDTCDIILIQRSVGNIFGMTRDQWVFIVDLYRHVYDDETVYTITDSLGITTMEQFLSLLDASGALINGRMYGTFTAVAPDPLTLPNAVHLDQNYPNPFNPTTTISFSIPRTTFTTLKIYNTLGQEIATMVSESLNPGTYSKQWNANGVASGVYYYRLQAGDLVQTRKLLLLR